MSLLEIYLKESGYRGLINVLISLFVQLIFGRTQAGLV